MNRLRVTFDVLWWRMHRWWIGIPLLIVLAGMIGCSSAVPKTYSSRHVFYRAQGLPPPPPPVLERAWKKLGLPLTVHSSPGFMGHGGFHLPRVFIKTIALGLIWSLLALVSWLIHRRGRARALEILQKYEEVLSMETPQAPRLSRQLLWGLLRTVALPCGMVGLYIVAGPVVAILSVYLVVLYFFPLTLYGLGRLAVRGIRGAIARRHSADSGGCGSAPDAPELCPERDAGDGEKIA